MVYQDIDIPLPAFIAIDFVSLTLALIPITIRFWLRRREAIPQPLTRNISDGLVTLAWLAGLVLVSINAWKNSLRERYTHDPRAELYYGVPRHLSAHLLYVSWISLFFIYISLWASKFALIAFFASVLKLMETRLSRFIMAFATLYTTSTFVLHIVLLTRWCSPVSRNWDINNHLCSAVHDIRSVSISTAANISTDLVILALPLFALTSLCRGRRARTMDTSITKAEWSGFAFVIAIAALSIVAALVRWITLKLVQNAPKANITHTIDVWALVEIVASLLAACLPSLRACVRRSRRGGCCRRKTGSGQSLDMLSWHRKGSDATVRSRTTSV
ncbi:hypothetical protein F5B17DRAFT_23300 [Nemania serpens]|nr:hypothetical protein F5B17DRAFT_23300 [Nemania serpens]